MGKKVTIEVVRDVEGNYERPVYESKGVFGSTRSTHVGGPPPDPNPVASILGVGVILGILALVAASAFQGCSQGHASPNKQQPPATVAQSVESPQRIVANAPVDAEIVKTHFDEETKEINRLISLQPWDDSVEWHQRVKKSPEFRDVYLKQLQNTQQAPEQVTRLMHSLEDLIAQFPELDAMAWRTSFRHSLAEFDPEGRVSLCRRFREILRQKLRERATESCASRE